MTVHAQRLHEEHMCTHRSQTPHPWFHAACGGQRLAWWTGQMHRLNVLFTSLRNKPRPVQVLLAPGPAQLEPGIPRLPRGNQV